MKRLITSLSIVLIFCSNILFAQLTVKDQETSPNLLFEVIDEGNAGSIFFPYLINFPIENDQKLYNVLGKLYWSGNELGTAFSAGGWNNLPGKVYLKTSTDYVGIGTGTPHVKLSLGEDFTPKKLALWDGENDFYGFGIAIGRITIYTNNTEKMTINAAGNVGINKVNPQAKLDVNGDIKIGSGGVVFSEILEMSGTTGGNGTNNVYVDYPAGYNSGNTRVLSLEIEDPYGGWASNGLFYEGRTVHCYLWSQIKIGYPEHSDFQSRPFRLVLMKIE